MITLCWSAKGGSGTTVVATTLALLSSRSLIVDLAGDVAPVLGIAPTDQPGVVDWIASSAPPAHIADLFVEIDTDTTLIPHRRVAGRSALIYQTPANESRWQEFGQWLRNWSTDHEGSVIVDAGLGPPPKALVENSDRNLLVTRPCYLALRSATSLSFTPTGIIVIDEPGRSLRGRDVETCVGAPIIATVSYDVAVARAVDSGLLGRRLPKGFRQDIERVAA